jgi:HEAT repeat protein
MIKKILYLGLFIALLTPVICAQGRGVRRMPPKRSFQDLVSQYEREKGQPPTVRGRTLLLFGSIKTDQCAAFLEEVYRKEPHPYPRMCALRALSNVGVPRAIRVLMGAVAEKDLGIRIAAIQGLGKSKAPEALPVLKRVLGQDPAQAVRITAARALGDFGTLEAAKALVESVQEPLKRNGNGRAANGRAANGREAVNRAIIEGLERIKSEDALRWLTEKVLGANGSVPLRRREIAIEVLGRKKWREAVSLLIRLLRSDIASLQLLSAKALGNIADARAVEPLMAMLQEKSLDLKAAALSALAEIRDMRALEPILKMAKSPDIRLKLLAVNVLGSFPDSRSLKAAVKALKSRRWQLQVAAVKAIAQMRRKEGITALIRAMKKAKGRVRSDILDALRRLTGADLGYEPEDWSAWWGKVKGDFVMPEEKPETEKGREKKVCGRTAVRNPVYHGMEVSSKRVIFLIDTSGSMSGPMKPNRSGGGAGGGGPNKMEVAKKELLKVIAALKSDVWFNVFEFNTGYKRWQKSLVKATARNKQAAVAFVSRMRPMGGTNIYDPLETALQDRHVDTVYLLSDGAPGSGKFVQPKRIREEIRRLNRFRNVKINTISFNGNRSFMEGLAKDNGGTFVDA